MAQRVLSPINVSSRDEAAGFTGGERLAQSLSGILKTITEGEQVRKQRQQLDRVTRAISAGATTPEAILAAAQEEPTFAGGIRGKVQKAIGGFAPGGGGLSDQIKQMVIGEALKKALSPSLLSPDEQKKGARIKAGIDPRASAALKQTEQFEQTKEDKALDRDIKVLKDEKKSTVQKDGARNRLRHNPTLKEAQPGTDFTKILKGQKKVRVGKLDRAFGEDAYWKALRKAQDAGLAQGFTEDSIEKNFNDWWDKKATQGAKGQPGFGKFVVPRPEFMDVAETPGTKIAPISKAKGVGVDTSTTITMVSLDGKVFNVPADKQQKFIDNGFKAQ